MNLKKYYVFLPHGSPGDPEGICLPFLMNLVAQHLNTNFSPLFPWQGKRQLRISHGKETALIWKRHITSTLVLLAKEYQGGREVK